MPELWHVGFLLLIVTLVLPKETYELYQAASRDPRKLMEDTLKEQAEKVFLARKTPQEEDYF